MIVIPVYRKNKEVIMFVPMSIAELKRSFSLVNEYTKLKVEKNKPYGKFTKSISLGSTKEYCCNVDITGVIDSKQKEGYLIKVDTYRTYNNEDKKEITGEHFFGPDIKIEDNAMLFFNETFGYEQGTPEQSEFFADIAGVSTKFKTFVEFECGKDSKKYFDLTSLAYDRAFNKNNTNEFYYISDYSVTPDNQFATFNYVKVNIEGDKFICVRKKLDLVINDYAEQHYEFDSFDKFTKFLTSF